MPFYEYQCTACSHQLEALQKISDEPLLYCPKCGEARLKKMISKAAFRLKGAGWYETDFKNSGKETKASTKSTDSESKTPKATTDNRDGASKTTSKNPPKNSPKKSSDTTESRPSSA